ncbi:uncharacterized protein LOC127122185 [Lathyrus oleraceus]|uniref:uncharacterized protein LOC127122185 n=1 Tax=Pisum sativum TaxID=3888 RepID=UPI0021D1C947|nr:uncharacterized protein LOC127122185 [Pisum sativum]
MKESETVSDYITRVQIVVNQLTRNGKTVTDAQVVENILISLTNKFENIVYAIEESKDLSTLSVEELAGSLEAHKQRKIKKKEEAVEEAHQTKESIKDEKNRYPHSKLEDQTPQEAWSGQKPTFSHLKVFGSVAYAHVPGQRRTKLEDKSKKYIFIGYDEKKKGYKLFDPKTKNVIVSRDVRINEESKWDWNNST